MNRYLKWTLQSFLFYLGMLGLSFGAVITLGCVAGVADKMFSSSLQIWWEIFIMINEIILISVAIYCVFMGFKILWERIEKIPEEK